MPARSQIYLLTIAIEAAAYLSLGLYVLTRRPGRTINRVFAAFCAGLAGFILTGLVLFPGRPFSNEGQLLLVLRLKWVIIVSILPLFFHLVSFYFPPSWQRQRGRLIVFLYGVSGVLIVLALSTDLLVAGVLYRDGMQIVGPVPGRLIGPLAITWLVVFGASVAGLVLRFRRAGHPAIRQRVLHFLAPILFIGLNSLVNWLIVLTSDTGGIPHEFGSLLLLASALLFARGTLLYGTLTGEPAGYRGLLVGAIVIGPGLLFMFVIWRLDVWLYQETPLNVPLLTPLTLLFFAISYPRLSRRLRQRWGWIEDDEKDGAETNGRTSIPVGVGEESLVENDHSVPAVGALTGEAEVASLAICAFDTLTVYRGGQRADEGEWGTAKAKGVLAFLLWRGEKGATRQDLIRVLWPEKDADEAANVFHVTMHRLRRVLEPERQRGSQYIVYGGGRYRFVSGSDCWVDQEEFERLAVAEDADSLRRAVALYRGPFLEDMAWALPVDAEAERYRLELLYETCLRRLLELHEISEGEAEFYLQRLLALNPADETALRHLIALYRQRGRPEKAGRYLRNWFRQAEQLNLEVAPATRRLHSRLLGSTRDE